MNVRNLILGTMLSVLLTGCQHGARNDTYMELMGAQRRALEDRIYDLEFDSEEMTDELKRLQEENQQLREQLNGSAEGTIPGLDIDPGNPRDGSQGIPRIKIDPGTPMDDPPKTNSEPSEEDNFELLPAPKNSGTNPERDVRSTTISHIVLNPNQTGITSFDEQNNNDGVVVSLEPRNRNDQYVNQSGAISIVVLDPAQTGQSARIARWNISHADVQKILATSSESTGITLELAWPGNPPNSNELLLFVRYETADGRKFETHTRITGKSTSISFRGTTSETFQTTPAPTQVSPEQPFSETSQIPPAKLRIPSAARSATSQPAANHGSRLQWRPYR